MFTRPNTIRVLALILSLAGGFTAPVTLVDQAVEAGYSRHVVERLPVDDVVEAILEGASEARSETPSECRPSPTVTSC